MKEILKYDEIGYWSEIKLDIVREYASAYSRILNSQKKPNLHYIYIDAFAGAGKHVSKSTGEYVPGSPLNALLVKPPFKEYHFIDLSKQKIQSLEQIAGDREDVFLYHADCNQVMLEEVLPRARYEDYKRALCLLDPYGLHLDWKVIHKAGQMRSVDIFLNFPIADMNRNVLLKKPQSVQASQIKRMNSYWGDDSWKDIAYKESNQMQLFGETEHEKVKNEAVAEAFRNRLKNVAGFKNVPNPMAMRNTQNAIVYYLFFASQKPVAEDIVIHIFKKYADKRG